MTDNPTTNEFAMPVEHFLQHFGADELPEALHYLLLFQEDLLHNQPAPNRYSGDFVVHNEHLRNALATWSSNPSFQSALYPFAQMNGAYPVFYALWDDGKQKSLNEMPVIAIGEQGGIHVVANHLVQFLQLLTLDAQLYIDTNTCYFYYAPNYQPSPYLLHFLSWLQERYGLAAINMSDATAIIENAQYQHGQALDSWLGQQIFS